MRLTLRTLLAYMDGMLDPKDTEALTAKIEESKFAKDLMHRIESVSKQLRLSAHKPDIKGANDANLVADYLDGTLSEERVAAFERMCLDSDLNLSELAACHTILTLVLGERAEVPPALRKRIHEIPHLEETVAAPPVQAPPQPSDDEPEEAPQVASVAEGERIPQPQEKRWAPLVATIAIALLVVLGALRLWAPLNRSHPLLARLSGEPTPTDGTPETPAPETQPEDGQPGGAQPADASASPGDPSAAENTKTPPEGVSEKPAEAATKPTPDEPTPGEPAPSKPAEPDASKPAEEPVPVPPKDSDPGTTDRPGEAKDVEVVKRGPEFGRFINTQQLLLRQDSEDGTWLRVGATEMLRVGDAIVCPPNFRPSLAMVNGVQLIFAGASSARLLDRDRDDLPTIGLDRGRVVLVTSGRAGAAIRFAVGDRAATITFGDAESSVAIQVRDYLAPGADPLAGASQKVLEAIPLGGSIEWTDANATHTIRRGQILMALDNEPATLHDVETTPEWTDLKVATSGTAPAAKTLEPAVTEGRPASLSLQEKVGFRQQDTVALAIDSLCMLGMPDAAIQSLSNERQHAYWPLHVAALRNEISRNPETATQVRDKLIALDSEDGETMFEMLVGFNAEQLSGGKAAALVEALEDEKMPLRVLAYENLRMITGRGNFFQAQKNAERQKDKIRFWKELLERNQIAYPTPPTPLPLREPAMP